MVRDGERGENGKYLLQKVPKWHNFGWIDEFQPISPPNSTLVLLLPRYPSFQQLELPRLIANRNNRVNLFIMSADNFYWYASVLIFAPWALLMFAPKFKYTEKIAFGCAILLLLAATFYTFAYLRAENAGGDLFSLEGFKNLFRSKEMLLTGWLNYLSFCLLVGVWQVHDSENEKIPHLFVIPSLLLTLVMGPGGLVVYLLIRYFKTGNWLVK
jgi:Domain of unknown function (DUF4281)